MGVTHGCVIAGFHGESVPLSACELCGKAVCADHRGYHWERSHAPPPPPCNSPLRHTERDGAYYDADGLPCLLLNQQVESP